MFFGYFLKTFGTFKRRGGAIERLKKKTFNIRYPIDHAELREANRLVKYCIC